MAANDEELKGLEDLFDADNPDDMADFMSMLDSIDMGDSPFSQEKDTEAAEDKEVAEEAVFEEDILSMADEVSDEDIADVISADEDDLPADAEFDMSELDMLDIDSLNMQTNDTSADTSAMADAAMEEETAFVSEDEDDILKLLDAVGEETASISEVMDPEDVADESVGEIADILAGFSEEDTEPDVPIAQPQEAVPKESVFKKFKEKFKKELTEEERFAKEQEETEVREWEEQEEEKKRIKKEEAQAKKQEKKAESERKKQQKAEAKAAKKAAKAEAKAAKKAEKEMAKGPIPKSQLVPVKPLVAFVIIGIAVSVMFVVFSDYRYYTASIDDSKEMFIHQKYKEAYEMLLGLDIKKKDEKFFEQVKTVRVVHKELEAYNNFVKVEDYEMALESLIKGIGKYGVQAEYAKELKLENEMYDLYEQFLAEITGRFGMTEQDAKNLYGLKDKESYEKQIEQIARDAAIRDGVLEPVEVTEIQE